MSTSSRIKPSKQPSSLPSSSWQGSAEDSLSDSTTETPLNIPPSPFSGCSTAVPFTSVTVRSNFWSPKILAIETQTLPAIYSQLVSSGRWDQNKWKPPRRDAAEDPKRPHHFWDSDIAKWVEACCYSLARPKSKSTHASNTSASSVKSTSSSFFGFVGFGSRTSSPAPSPIASVARRNRGPSFEMEKLVEQAIKNLQNVQMKDGYLNTYFTVVEPGKRLTNLMEMHELYSLGHLLEAALAHATYVGQDSHFLKSILAYVDLVNKTFGPVQDGKKPGYGGHQEIELALMRLFDMMGREQDKDLVDFFIHERGKKDQNGEIYWDKETRLRNGTPASKQQWRTNPPYAYNQAQGTIFEQTEIEGHSVRAVYWLTGAVHLARVTGDQELLEAAKRLWDNMVGKKMYVTGGLGAIGEWEGFGPNHYLPNETGYLETCASIGLVFLAHQFILTFPQEPRYADVLELALLNSVLVGMSLDGTRFFYENPLASVAGNIERNDWFECSCCPPNVARLLTSLGKYIYSVGPLPSNSDDFVEVGEELIFVHLYVASTAEVELSSGDVTIVQEECDWPWTGKVVLRIEATQTLRKKVRIALRIPEWADRFDVTDSNGRPLAIPSSSSSLIITPSAYFSTSPTVTLRIPIKPRLINPHHLDNINANSVCFARGPLIYAAEARDNQNIDLRSIRIPDNPKMIEYRDTTRFSSVEGLTSPFEPVVVKVGAVQLVETILPVEEHGDEDEEEEEEEGGKEKEISKGGRRMGLGYKEIELTLVPYFSILNRGKNAYRIWFPRFK